MGKAVAAEGEEEDQSQNEEDSSCHEKVNRLSLHLVIVEFVMVKRTIVIVVHIVVLGCKRKIIVKGIYVRLVYLNTIEGIIL